MAHAVEIDIVHCITSCYLAVNRTISLVSINDFKNLPPIKNDKALGECFPTRVLQNSRVAQNIVRGSLRNRGISPVQPTGKEQHGEHSSLKRCPYLQVMF
jgi:hypothetical protein